VVSAAWEVRCAKQYGLFSFTFLNQKSSSDLTGYFAVEDPIHPTKFTILVRSLCNERKYRLALGNWARRKFKDPIRAAYFFESTTSAFRTWFSQSLICDEVACCISGVIISVSDGDDQSQPRKRITCDGVNSHFFSESVQPKDDRYAAI
jgi:hypothetical protein